MKENREIVRAMEEMKRSGRRMALATVVLIRSMVGHLRKVRYSPDPAAPQQEPTAGDPGTPADPVASSGPQGGEASPPPVSR